MIKLTNLGKMTLLAVGATFAFGTHAVRAGTLESIASQCQAAANFVNTDPTAKKPLSFGPRLARVFGGAL
jgi:hypothetical protein